MAMGADLVTVWPLQENISLQDQMGVSPASQADDSHCKAKHKPTQTQTQVLSYTQAHGKQEKRWTQTESDVFPQVYTIMCAKKRLTLMKCQI